MKKILIWSAIVILLLILPSLVGKLHRASYSDKQLTILYQHITARNVRSAKITGEYLEWDDLSGNKFQTTIPPDNGYEIVEKLKDHGATVKFVKSSDISGWPIILISWLPLVLNISILVALVFLIISIIKLRRQTANPSQKL